MCIKHTHTHTHIYIYIIYNRHMVTNNNTENEAFCNIKFNAKRWKFSFRIAGTSLTDHCFI